MSRTVFIGEHGQREIGLETFSWRGRFLPHLCYAVSFDVVERLGQKSKRRERFTSASTRVIAETQHKMYHERSARPFIFESPEVLEREPKCCRKSIESSRQPDFHFPVNCLPKVPPNG